MLMEFLNFAFSGFWTFVGVLLLISVPFSAFGSAFGATYRLLRR